MSVYEFLTSGISMNQPIKIITILGKDPEVYSTAGKLLEEKSEYLNKEVVEWWDGAIDTHCISIRIPVV